MLVIGAKGFAKQVLEVFLSETSLGKPVFFDDMSPLEELDLREDFRIIRTWDEVAQYFREEDSRFILGIGGPLARARLFDKAIGLGGEPYTLISPNARISSYRVKVGKGVCILSNVVIENHVSIGDGVLLNIGSMVTHDCIVGDFSEISPAASLMGAVRIGKCTFVGSGATILPKLTVGRDVTIAAGALVTRDIPDGVLAMGVPAVIQANTQGL